MCLAIPARVVSIEDTVAKIDVMGNVRTTDLTLVEDVSVNDYVLVHAGFAIRKLDPKEAEETLELFKTMENALETPGD